MAGGVPRAAGKASSVTAAPCQLPQRVSRGRFAPFLPPAFMRGEGHAVAGGVPRRSGESLLSHGCAVPAPPEGKPRALRTVLAPRIYEGEGHAVAGGVLRRSGDGPLSHGFAVPALPKGEPRGLRPDHRSFRTGSQTGVRIPRMKGKWNEGISRGGSLPPENVRFSETPQ